jgi:hypothetical protein
MESYNGIIIALINALMFPIVFSLQDFDSFFLTHCLTHCKKWLQKI